MTSHDPFQIDKHTLSRLSFRLVRDFRVLPFSADASSLWLFCYDVPELTTQRRKRLEDETRLTLHFVPIDQATLDRAIDFHFPDSVVSIRNCPLDYECPKKWAELRPTENLRERYCSTCDKTVHWFVSEREALRLGQGMCVAYADEYGEYVGKIEGHY